MKILLIRFSSIGDIVLTTPVVRCLKQQLGAELHFLTKGAFVELLEPNPYLDKIYSFKQHIRELLPALRSEKYDLVIDLHHNLRSLQVKWSLGRPYKSFHKLNFKKWLLVNFGKDRLPKQHIVDRYLATVQHLNVQNDGKGLDHFIPLAMQVDLHLYSGLFKPGKFVAFAIGATHATKRLTTEKMLEICQGIPLPIALLGGPAEAAAGEFLAKQLGANVLNLCGKLGIHQSASVLAQSAVVISHDTGLMHIAAALGKDMVSVWGSTVPQFGMYPYYPEGIARNTSVEVTGLRCRPCSKIGFQSCPKGHFKCIKDIDIQQVVTAAIQST